ncbi:uncharacterized protein LOC114539025 [Dendronephthya gigantea]|uniref:uncharacterized protein LOC114539025 n=1 Tax=Dendronephthya gigantea TaxID=151771 RepID=UPI00106A0D64|nr:uncharacterized protein LOC114539025 [Dendronephthya gigantea]
MAKVRDEYWIPRLRRMARRVRKNCFGCKRFHATRLPNPQPGKLPKDRSSGELPFQVVGVDYAGPIRYRAGNKQERKAYILVYACSLTRALYLEVTKTLSTEEFLNTLKRFIARKGRPEKIYSDNAKTFVAGAKWLKRIMQDERFNDELAKMAIKWQFNLSRAPWWGGQYERLIGLIKQALYKSIGNGHLTGTELEEVILDIESKEINTSKMTICGNEQGTSNGAKTSCGRDGEENRGKWRLGIVQSLITGKDGIVQGARLQVGQSNIERAVQHLYPMELSCDAELKPATSKLRADVPEFRPKRNAAAIAECRIKDIGENEDD